MLYDCNCLDVLQNLGDKPRISKFNLIPNDYLSFGETLCILSNDDTVNTFILKSYIAEILSNNDIKLLYLDTSVNFTYSKFKTISESFGCDVQTNFDRITYIPVPSPTQLLLLINILYDYLKLKKEVRVIVIDKLNFWSSDTLKEKDLNKMLNQCYRELKKLQSKYQFLLVYTKMLGIYKNNLQRIINSHYRGYTEYVYNKNTVILALVPKGADYQVFTFRFKRSFNLKFRKCQITQIISFDTYSNSITDGLIDDLMGCNDKDEGMCELEEVSEETPIFCLKMGINTKCVEKTINCIYD